MEAGDGGYDLVASAHRQVPVYRLPEAGELALRHPDLYFNFVPAVWDDPRNRELFARAGKHVLEKYGEQR